MLGMWDIAYRIKNVVPLLTFARRHIVSQRLGSKWLFTPLRIFRKEGGKWVWAMVGNGEAWTREAAAVPPTPPRLGLVGLVKHPNKEVWNIRFQKKFIPISDIISDPLFSVRYRKLWYQAQSDIADHGYRSKCTPLNVYTVQNPRRRVVSVKTSQMRTICTLIWRESCLLVYIFTSDFILGWCIFVDMHFPWEGK